MTTEEKILASIQKDEQQTLVFVKPMEPGFSAPGIWSEELAIHSIMLQALTARFDCVKIFPVTLTGIILHQLYQDLSPALYKQTLRHLENQTVRVLVFKLESALKRMSGIVGNHPDPEKCLPSTFRHRWWEFTRDHHKDPSFTHGLKVSDTETYWYNFIHCTRTKEEFEIHYGILSLYAELKRLA